MALRDLAAFLEDDGLDYPLRASDFSGEFPTSKACKDSNCPLTDRHAHYRVPSPSAKVGLWLTSLADLGMKASAGADLTADDVASLKLDDDEERSLYQRVLGPTYDAMLADNVKWTALQRVGQDAYLCFAMSPETADAALTSLGKAPANRAQRRAAAKSTAGRRSARASGAGTKSGRGTASRTSA